MADLPAPVGNTATTLRPATAAVIASSWPGRSWSNPSRSRASRRIDSAVGAVAAILPTLDLRLERAHEETVQSLPLVWDCYNDIGGGGSIGKVIPHRAHQVL